MADESQQDTGPDGPRLAIRRHTDRCFHAVEEVVPEGPMDSASAGIRGYIIDGVMIDADDVAEVRTIPDGGPGLACMDARDNR
jgi:hypothetical protein